MTNREKLKEVFGFDIPKNEHYFCTIIDDKECQRRSACEEICPAFNWWDKEYTGGPSIKTLDVASMHPSSVIAEKLVELKGIVKLLRFAESKMGIIPFEYEDKVIVKEMIKFCADDIEEMLSLLMKNHKVPQLVKASMYKTKTGRHFPQIVEILEQMWIESEE